MTRENCIQLLQMYKKQSENPVNSDGQPLTGFQRKHAIERSKLNYRNMALHIMQSKKFNGATMTVRTRSGVPAKRVFEKHPIVDELKREFGLLEAEAKPNDKKSK